MDNEVSVSGAGWKPVQGWTVPEYVTNTPEDFRLQALQEPEVKDMPVEEALASDELLIASTRMWADHWASTEHASDNGDEWAGLPVGSIVMGGEAWNQKPQPPTEDDSFVPGTVDQDAAERIIGERRQLIMDNIAVAQKRGHNAVTWCGDMIEKHPDYGLIHHRVTIRSVVCGDDTQLLNDSRMAAAFDQANAKDPQRFPLRKAPSGQTPRRRRKKR